MKPHIALASCGHLRPEEVDDQPFWAALRALGATVSVPHWHDADVDWDAFDGCLIRTTWDYQERPLAFLEWARSVAASIPLFNPAPIIKWNLNKGYLADLEARGFEIVPTYWAREGEAVDLAALCAERGWQRAFIKPQVGANAHGTLRFSTQGDELRQAQAFLDEALGRGPQMIQPYLPSVETRGELSLIHFDGQFSHATRKIPVPGDYRVQDDWGASDCPEAPSPRALAIADRLARSVVDTDGSPLLYARLDLMEGLSGELYIVEYELIEPSLFFRHCDQSPKRLAEALLKRL